MLVSSLDRWSRSFGCLAWIKVWLTFIFARELLLDTIKIAKRFASRPIISAVPALDSNLIATRLT